MTKTLTFCRNKIKRYLKFNKLFSALKKFSINIPKTFKSLKKGRCLALGIEQGAERSGDPPLQAQAGLCLTKACDCFQGN